MLTLLVILALLAAVLPNLIMANSLLTISMITREALRVLENNLVFTKHVRRDFDDSYGKTGAKIGTVLNIRKPPRYVGRVGQALQLEDATETSVALALNTQRGVDLAFTSQDLSLSVDDFADRFIKPGVASVANGVDLDGTGLYSQIYNMVGTPGAVPNLLLTYLQAGQKLDEEAAPRDETRALVITPAMQATIIDALKTLFHSGKEIEDQYKDGTMGLAIGFKWSMDQNLRTQKFGPQGGTPAVNGAGQVGASLVTNGWTAAAANRLKAGDTFTIAGVNAVNPQSKQDTGSLRIFVVLADVASDGAGNATIPIAPAIIPAGPFQNVTNSPANTNLLTILGAPNTVSPQGLAFHRDAFVLGCADLLLPGGVDMASRVSDKQLGLSLRMIRAYDINLDRFPCRLDVLYGWAVLYQELCTRIAS